jgi:hypothetical protein
MHSSHSRRNHRYEATDQPAEKAMGYYSFRLQISVSPQN